MTTLEHYNEYRLKRLSEINTNLTQQRGSYNYFTANAQMVQLQAIQIRDREEIIKCQYHNTVIYQHFHKRN